MKDGRRIYVLAQGRLVNLAAAEGHPSEVMDMSFANQYLALCRLAKDGKTLDKKVYELPKELDQEIAGIKLADDGRRRSTSSPPSRSRTRRLLRRHLIYGRRVWSKKRTASALICSWIFVRSMPGGSVQISGAAFASLGEHGGMNT